MPDSPDPRRGLMSLADQLKAGTDANRRRSPRVEVIRVIEVRFLRGEGLTEADPVREVVALYRADDGSPIVEIDPFAVELPA